VHPDRELVNVAQSFGIESGEGLLAALGQGDISVVSVVQRLHPDLREEPTPRKSPFTRLKEMAQRSPEGIQIQGMGNLMIRLAKCCQPVPGEQIVGMVTRGRGLSVHRVDCPNVFEDRVPAERRVELSWDVPDTRAFVVKLLVFGDDRKGMLADLAQAVAEAGTNIVNADIRAVDGDARGTFLVEVNNLSHLQHVIKAMGRVKGVRAVERSTTGGEE
jgi:GTP pyrophosphokinase